MADNADEAWRRLRKEEQERAAKEKAGRGRAEPHKRKEDSEKEQLEYYKKLGGKDEKRAPRKPPVEVEDRYLPNGFEIQNKPGGAAYKVELRLAKRVFVVRNMQTTKLYACKADCYPTKDPAVKQLKRDVFVLMDAAKHDPKFTRHFLKLHKKGRIGDVVNYVHMTLCDHNLDDIRMKVLKDSDFSRADGGRLAMQTFQAVHDLHSLGFLHRDLSPSKFVLGIDNPHLVYLVGFSMAFHFQQHYDSKPSASPRRLPKMAARSFLSRGYHRAKEMHRKDDLESWLYLCFNLFGRRVLPWNETTSDAEMLEAKELFFSRYSKHLPPAVPSQFQTIIRNFGSTEGGGRPDYAAIGTELLAMKNALKFHFHAPFDWQQEKKPKAEEALKKDEEEFVLTHEDAAPTPEKEEKPRKEAFQDEDDDDYSPKAVIERARHKPNKHTKSKANYRLDRVLDNEQPKEDEEAPAVENKKRRSKSKKRRSKPATTPPAGRPTTTDLLMAQMEAMRKQNEQMAARLEALASAQEGDKMQKKKTEKHEAEQPKEPAGSAEKLEREGADDSEPSDNEKPAGKPGTPSAKSEFIAKEMNPKSP